MLWIEFKAPKVSRLIHDHKPRAAINLKCNILENLAFNVANSIFMVLKQQTARND